jgi:aminoglycoside phosphotransferase (APT) family kinase protein
VTVEPSKDELEHALSAARSVSGGDVLSVVPLAGGEIHTVVRVTTTVDDLVVRLERSEPPDWHPTQDGEIAAMRLAEQAGVRTPTVVTADPGLLIYRHVNGRPLADADSEAAGKLARQAGREFGRLHSIHGNGLGPVQADGSNPGWPPDTFIQSVPTEAASLRALPDRLDLELVDAGVELIDQLRPTMRSRLVHGDASPTNVIIHGNAIAAIIDFEAAWFADPAIDMAWWWWNSPPTATAFQAGCEEVSEPTDDDRLWVHRTRLLIGLAATFAAADITRAKRINALLNEAVHHLRQVA